MGANKQKKEQGIAQSFIFSQSIWAEQQTSGRVLHIALWRKVSSAKCNTEYIMIG